MIDDTGAGSAAAPGARRTRRPWRLQTKLTLVVVVLVFMSVAISTLVVLYEARRDLRAHIERDQITEAERAAAEIGEYLRRSREVVEDLARRTGPAELADLRRLEETILGESGALQFFSDLLFLDATLTARADRPVVPNRRGTDYADRPHLQRALATGETVLSAPFMGRVTRQPAISVTAPVKDASGRSVALVNGTISLLQIRLLRELGNRDPQRETAYLVADDDNRVVVHFAPDRLLTQVRSEAVRGVIATARDGQRTVTREGVSTSGEPTLYSATPVPGTRWVVLAGTRAAVAFPPLARLDARLFAALVVVMLATALVAWRVIQWQLHPLGRLHEDVERLGSAHPARRLAGTGEPRGKTSGATRGEHRGEQHGQEIDDLAAAFARLGQRLQQHGDEIARARALVERVFDNTPDWIFLKDAQRRFVVVNRAFCQALQIDETDLLGRTWDEVIAEPPLRDLASDAGDTTRRDDERALTGETFVAPVHAWRRPDGVERMMRILRTPLRHDDGSVHGVLTIGQDVSALHEAERRLAAANRVLAELATEPGDETHEAAGFLTSVVGAAPYGIAAYDATGACVFANAALARLRGTSPDVLRAENLHASAFWRDAGLVAVAERALRSDAPLRHEARVAQNAGRSTWLDCHLAAFRHDDATYQLLVVADATERRELHAQALATRDQAEAASRAKTVFLAHMSHELRTPLNAIAGFGQLLEKEALTRRQQDHVGEIQRAGLHLQSLLDDLHDVSRIETGELTITCAAVDLQAALREAAGMVRAALERAGVTLEYDVPGAPCRVLADATRLRQVIATLLSNAIKLNADRGRIVLRIEPSGTRTRLSVSDVGPGIAPDKLARLFVPFERLGLQDAAVPGGGIGLSLAKRLTELMNGAIGADSEPGRGSRLWVEFGACEPLADPARDNTRDNTRDNPRDDARAPAATGGLDGIGSVTVLYIEDNLANQRVIANLLARMPGVMLVTATTGRAGVNAARETLPHAILLDIQLPDIDGYAVLAELRADPLTRAIPVIALTAAAMPHDMRRAEGAGFARYLTKPVHLETLLETLRTVLVARDAR